MIRDYVMLGESMKNISYTLKLTAVIIFCFTFGCSESGSGGGNGSNTGSGGGGAPIVGGGTAGSGKACNSYTPIAGAFDAAQRHVYLGEFRLDRNSGPQGAYRNFLDDFGLFCMNNTGFKFQPNPYNGRLEYARYFVNGVANCNMWDDFFKIWIIFPRNDPRRAHLVIDATMSGFPDGWTGQGYDLQRHSLPDSQINCNVTDKTIIYYEPVQGFQFRVEIYQGDKNSERLRAEVFYKNSSIGRSDFFIIQN